jgi:hypothetical protein
MLTRQIKFFLLLTITVFSLAGFSQNNTIKGFVYEKETGEPVIYTNVMLFKTGYGATTDQNGFFMITKIPAGDYNIIITTLGYDTLREVISLKKGDMISKKLYLKKATYEIKGVNISAEAEKQKTETNISVISISPKKIVQLPSVGGTPDIAQYLQVMPGIVFTGDQGGQLYIRGGSPVQNKVLLDGMVVYNPFHSIGLFSVFDTDILKNADVYTGGFGAEYGGRISSVMDITTRDGNKKRFSGKVDATTFGAKLLIEGPIVKQKDDSKASASFILSAKNSYLKQTSKLLYKYVDTAGLPFNYTDIYAKISVNAPNGSKVGFFGFNFNDNVDYRSIAKYNWSSYGGGTNFVVIPGKSSMIVEGHFAYSQYKMSMVDATELPKESSINGFNLGLNFTSFSGKNELSYGIELQGFNTDFNFYNSVNRKISQAESTTELGAFVKYKWTLKKFLIEPSFRLQVYPSLSNFSPEPRLSVKYMATKWFRVKFAAGMYSQNLISANSDRDVVNLFYGFVSGPDNLQSEFDGRPLKDKLQKADHVILGFEFDILKNLNFNVEGYYKWFTQLTNINRNKVFDDSPEYYDEPDYLKKDFIVETGNAEGVDFSLKYELKHIYLWAVYSLGFINRYDGIVYYQPQYDRRHNVNLVFSWTFGKNMNWEIDARWNLGSGFPFTQTQGFYENITFSNGLSTDYVRANGDLGVQYAELNKGRLPWYHRLDIGAKRSFQVSENAVLEINIGVTNVYDRANIFYFDRVTYQRINQLPIMPSFGISFKY